MEETTQTKHHTTYVIEAMPERGERAAPKAEAALQLRVHVCVCGEVQERRASRSRLLDSQYTVEGPLERYT